MAGLGVFVLTWLGGHPLLVPEVAYPFWAMLGVVAGSKPAQPLHQSWWPWALGALVLGLAMSLPLRVHAKTALVDFSRVGYGFSNWSEPSGIRARRVNERAKLFVRANVERISFPAQARAVSNVNPIELDIVIDKRLVTHIRFADIEWKKIEVPMPPTDHEYREVELRVRRPSIPDGVPEGRPSRRLTMWVGEIASTYRAKP
jgi:hypothetical protein